MCGIAGHIRLDGKKADAVQLRAMLTVLSHRGPSGQGEWVKGSVAFGMRRLSIIDVAGGDQPLFNEDKSISIVGNGEIYNYKELQTALRQKGHTLRTGSDIETITHLYEEYGLECFAHMRGMFGICMHDVANDLIIIARDRVGEKPLYWTKVGQSIVFASEMKALVSFPGVKKELDLESVARYFAFYYVPEPRTMLQNVSKLEAGSYMVINTKTGSISQKRYWFPESKKTTSTANPTKALRKELEEVGKITLRSDVPVGISLSGGLDSATVLALAAKSSTKNLKAFSVGYTGRPATDERAVAKKLAQHFGVEYFEREISTQEMLRDFPKTVFAADDPVADIAAYGIYAVAKLARDNNVPVLLSGVGGDELFWGYPWMRQAAKDSVTLSYRDVPFYERSAGFAHGLGFSRLLFSKRIQEKLHEANLYFFKPRKAIQSKVALGRYMVQAIRDVWLTGDCLVLGDRMSMAASVELRVPLVDYKLIELIESNEKTVTAFEQSPKLYLKEAIQDLLPSDHFQRKKQGFTPPVGQWLYAILSTYLPTLKNGYLMRTGLLNNFMLSVIFLVWRVVPFLWYQLYALIILEVWCQLYIEGKDSTSFIKVLRN